MKKKSEIYLDNAATTKIDERVLKSMIPYLKDYYENASSIHEKGRNSRKVLEKSRESIGKSINAKKEEIYFTSGGTESNNFALKGLFFYNKENKTGKNQIITSSIEHESVLDTCRWLEKQGAKVIYLKPDSQGFISLKDIERNISNKTIMVSIIHGNNEIGTIQDINKIGEICNERKVLFHSDVCQSFTKEIIDVENQKIDLMTLNSHKIHGPKGVGALYIRKGVKIVPLHHGGGHEKKLRSGTENIPGIVGFAKAAEISKIKDTEKIIFLREMLIDKLLKIKGIKLNGSREKRLCNNVNILFEDLPKNVDGETLVEYLENEHIYVSVGSACMSHLNQSNHVLRSIGLSENEIKNSLRISLSKFTKKQDIEHFLEKLNVVLKKLKRIY